MFTPGLTLSATDLLTMYHSGNRDFMRALGFLEDTDGFEATDIT